MVGLSFVSQATILPAFAAYLGAPNVVLGAIPAVMTLGWFLPSLFAAGHTEALGQKLPFVLRLTVWERAPFLVLALAAFVAAERTPALVLGVLLTMLLVVTGVRSEEHTSELQSQSNLVCRLLLEKKKKKQNRSTDDMIC